jgi:phage terminase small subunit
MPRPRLPDQVKAARGTLKASRSREAPIPAALTDWPPAPKYFNPAEKAAWKRLGGAVMELSTISRADLLFCERVAQVSARVDAALKDKAFKPTALNAIVKLESDLRRQLGISPQARTQVQPLAAEVDEDEEDPLGEFGPGRT